MILRKWFEKLIFVPWFIVKTNTQCKRKLKIYKGYAKNTRDFSHGMNWHTYVM